MFARPGKRPEGRTGIDKGLVPKGKVTKTVDKKSSSVNNPPGGKWGVELGVGGSTHTHPKCRLPHVPWHSTPIGLASRWGWGIPLRRCDPRESMRVGGWENPQKKEWDPTASFEGPTGGGLRDASDWQSGASYQHLGKGLLDGSDGTFSRHHSLHTYVTKQAKRTRTKGAALSHITRYYDTCLGADDHPSNPNVSLPLSNPNPNPNPNPRTRTRTGCYQWGITWGGNSGGGGSHEFRRQTKGWTYSSGCFRAKGTPLLVVSKCDCLYTYDQMSVSGTQTTVR